MSKDLPKIDIDSPTWGAIKLYLSGVSKSDITQLKNPSRTHEETNVIRGRLLIVDQILALEEKILKHNQQAF